MYKQLLEYFTKEFIKRVGRSPQTPSEVMSIQDDVVRYLNKTKGVPEGPKKPPFQGFTPKVIKGGKPKEGIESVISQETFNVKSPLVQDDALRIKQGLSTRIKLNSAKENAQMVKDLILRKNKEFNSLNRTQQKEILNRIQNQIKESKAQSAKTVNPDDEMPFASGGIARVGYFAGEIVKPKNWKLFKEFVEKLFIKSSNDIRLGKGKWAGLDQKQKMVQHDNLTTLVEQFQKTGKFDKKANEYFGIDAEKAFTGATKKVDKNRKLTDEEWKDYVQDNEYELSPYREELTGDETIAQLDDMIAEQKAYEADMHREYMRGDLDKYVKPEVLEEQALRRQKKIDEVLAKAYDEIAGGSGFTDDYKMAADELADSIAEQLGKGAFDELPQTHQTQIYNTALKRVTGDLKKRLSKPTKTLEGIEKEGTIDISNPEVADEFSKFMKESDPEGFKDIEQKIQIEGFDVTGRKKNASGGRASRGLNYLLGEDDQNVRMPSPGGLPGLLGE